MIMCTLPTPTGRISITNEGLKISENGEMTQTALNSNEEFSEAFRKYLGVNVEW
jgi:arylamine N-acetyltransferase